MKLKPPNPKKHNPSPDNVLKLVERAAKVHDCSQNEVAKKMGVGSRAIRYWLNGDRTMPYTAQYTLEALGCTS